MASDDPDGSASILADRLADPEGPSIVVTHPQGRNPERTYAADVVFGAWLGLDVQHRVEDRDDTVVTVPGSDGEMVLRDDLLACPRDDWLTPASLPREPLERWKPEEDLADLLVTPDVPVLYGRPLEDGAWMERREDRATWGMDILGAVFFLLTRYEEVVSTDRDDHVRFPASASLASREGFLDRPLANELVELLWATMKELWPDLSRRDRTFRVRPTHDVDVPLDTQGRSLRQILQSTAGDVLVRNSPGLALRRVSSLVRTETEGIEADLYNTFDELMSGSEARGLTSTFFFKTRHTEPRLASRYDIEAPWCRQLLRSIHDRGHRLGLHPSYETFRDGEMIQQEFDRLRTVCGQEGIDQEVWPGRQHYLRWEAPTTWQLYDDVGLGQDETLSFADRAGFRTGSCWPYPAFNLRTRRRLDVVERPLIAMDASLVQTKYMDLTHEDAAAVAAMLRERCARYDGEFSVLWHNNRLLSDRDWDLYRAVLDGRQTTAND